MASALAVLLAALSVESVASCSNSSDGASSGESAGGDALGGPRTGGSAGTATASAGTGGPGGGAAGGGASGAGVTSLGGSAGASGTVGVTSLGGSAGVATGGTSGATSGGAGASGTNAGGAASGGIGGASAGGSAGSTSGGAGGGDAGNPTPVSTDPQLKVAFIGDTATGANLASVLNVIKGEGTDALVVEGDMSYADDPDAWWTVVESVLGTTFPVFIARGNHDDGSWAGYLPKAADHLGGAMREAGAHDANYKTTYRGLVIATIRKGDAAASLEPFLKDDPHVWKICQWHQNQQAMQVGGKTDEMGWEVYETCRQYGAIIETGHEHSYERTRTLTSMTDQIVDTTCDGAGSLCVGPGRTFANVVGLGGNSVRGQSRCLPATFPYGCNGEWAFIYTSDQSATYGAQFIVFNDGGPNVATGYFKNVNDQIVDTFTITHD